MTIKQPFFKICIKNWFNDKVTKKKQTKYFKIPEKSAFNFYSSVKLFILLVEIEIFFLISYYKLKK